MYDCWVTLNFSSKKKRKKKLSHNTPLRFWVLSVETYHQPRRKEEREKAMHYRNDSFFLSEKDKSHIGPCIKEMAVIFFREISQVHETTKQMESKSNQRLQITNHKAISTSLA